MNFRGQAGLEYLMTYGWALVIIVTVIGVLFMVISPSANQFACKSSDPKIILQSYNLPYSPGSSASFSEVWGRYSQVFADTPGKMVLINGTGGKITVKNVYSAWSSSNDTTIPGCTYGWCFLGWGSSSCYATAPVTTLNGIDTGLILSNNFDVQSGRTIAIDNLTIIKGVSPSSCRLEDFSFPANPSFNIVYQDYSGVSRNVDITCNGYPPKA